MILFGESIDAQKDMSNLKVVGIGGWAVSNNREDILRTYALGSCVALILHHPMSRTMGLVHIVLPDPLCHVGKKHGKGYYASSAVPMLQREVCAAAGLSSSDSSGIIAKLVGGAAVIKIKNPFHFGERILREILQTLHRLHIPVVKQDTGGSISRTVSLYIESGDVLVKSPGTQKRPL
ncbi:chemotaxis protein CheD [Thiovibrio frasassiensis]|uniref:Probable chemoreceptor glutamine deamidase CheD n=1 Tax=Thiovibrio frasassiensis TaxID=2984131 RepID=A0A9X4MFI0_9BACT|nr:chemotaxis protein CheD [Thiovibrio frasassiensis]MDG4475305.1 chemotaxis protein CheD [Thiovibrio frasassiensis]